ncbi:MAG TPA: hypothetical protein VE988_21860, partial [Gemmataceae bacterium]|nr:hypothetical protein [Gemmataceae bacterium]
GRPVATLKDNQCELEFLNGSRVIALPGREETIRTYQSVNLLILDEAARIPDALYSSLSPMTGVSKGRTICLSTPFGQNGFFWREWHNEAVHWTRFRVTWQQCPRLTVEFIENERRKFGDVWIRQEYECSFEGRFGLVYPEFEKCVGPLTPDPSPRSGERGAMTDPSPLTTGRLVGGIDFGFRNPFAAIWGYLYRDDVLHIVGEIYKTQTTVDQLADLLPKGVTWYADPSGPGEITMLRMRGHCVREGRNEIRLGIQAVTERIRTDRLKVDAKQCPNLIREARLYHYEEDGGETPVDADNHALAALRYMILRLDKRRLRVS